MIELYIPGIPAPKGSMKAVPTPRGPRLKNDNAKTAPWMSAVAWAARVAMQGRERFEGVPLSVEMVLAMPRPSSHYGKRGLLKSAPVAPMTKPDIDKLERAVWDALEGIVFDNDSRIVESATRQIYVGPEHSPGAWIVVREFWDGERRYRDAALRYRMVAEGLVYPGAAANAS